MKILHTFNWHRGRTLNGGKRYEEFKSFLSWLPEGIQKEQVDNMIKEKHEIHSRR